MYYAWVTFALISQDGCVLMALNPSHTEGTPGCREGALGLVFYLFPDLRILQHSV